jgi:hypothetical protein
MARRTGKLIFSRIAGFVVAALAIAAIAAPGKPALAQYSNYYYYPYQGYYQQYGYYPTYPQYPPWYYYDPYGHPLLNDPNYPCVWEGRGCPIVH